MFHIARPVPIPKTPPHLLLTCHPLARTTATPLQVAALPRRLGLRSRSEFRRPALCVCGSTAAEEDTEEAAEPGADTRHADEYTKEMQAKMGSALTYVHENGINYARVTEELIVGSCLQTASDVDTIREEEGVATILCLQEDKDMAWWNLDINPIQERAGEIAGIKHLREPMRDFDPYSVRMRLPSIVRTLVKEVEATSSGTAYIHCTAGLGRAPAVALAYMHWIKGIALEDAYAQLFAVRPCHPQLKSIRSATCDILAGGSAHSKVKLTFPKGSAHQVEVAGLHVGWGGRLTMQLNANADAFELEAKLPVGMYLYKYIVDGEWVINEAETIVEEEDGNVNNYVEVLPQDAVDTERRSRLVTAEAEPTPGERIAITRYLVS